MRAGHAREKCRERQDGVKYFFQKEFAFAFLQESECHTYTFHFFT